MAVGNMILWSFGSMFVGYFFFPMMYSVVKSYIKSLYIRSTRRLNRILGAADTTPELWRTTNKAHGRSLLGLAFGFLSLTRGEMEKQAFWPTLVNAPTRIPEFLIEDEEENKVA